MIAFNGVVTLCGVGVSFKRASTFRTCSTLTRPDAGAASSAKATGHQYIVEPKPGHQGEYLRHHPVTAALAQQRLTQLRERCRQVGERRSVAPAPRACAPATGCSAASRTACALRRTGAGVRRRLHSPPPPAPAPGTAAYRPSDPPTRTAPSPGCEPPPQRTCCSRVSPAEAHSRR